MRVPVFILLFVGGGLKAQASTDSLIASTVRGALGKNPMTTGPVYIDTASFGVEGRNTVRTAVASAIESISGRQVVGVRGSEVAICQKSSPDLACEIREGGTLVELNCLPTLRQGHFAIVTLSWTMRRGHESVIASTVLLIDLVPEPHGGYRSVVRTLSTS